MLWTPQAVYVDPATGEETVGRDEIEKVFSEAFEDKEDVKLTADVESITFFHPMWLSFVARPMSSALARSPTIRNSPSSASSRTANG